MNHLSQKKIYSLAYQWIMAKEAEGITDEEFAELANAVIGVLRFVRQACAADRGWGRPETRGLRGCPRPSTPGCTARARAGHYRAYSAPTTAS